MLELAEFFVESFLFSGDLHALINFEQDFGFLVRNLLLGLFLGLVFHFCALNEFGEGQLHIYENFLVLTVRVRYNFEVKCVELGNFLTMLFIMIYFLEHWIHHQNFLARLKYITTIFLRGVIIRL
jgi:hypothetical protein